MEFNKFSLWNEMKFGQTLGAFALLAGAAISSAWAAEAELQRRWYSGIGVGPSRAKVDDGRINGTLLSAGFATAAMTARDERDVGFKLFAGYQFNRNFALEGGYFQLGQFNFSTATTGPAGTLTGNAKPRGVNLDAVGILPIAGNFSAIGRVGAQSAEANDSYAGTGGVAVLNPNPGKWETNYKLGVGLQYDFTKSIGLRGEVERYRINDAASHRRDIDVYSAGLVVKFH